jgi:hypothetical protein
LFALVPAGPGIGYTAEVTSADGISTGIALVEIYNLP